MCYVAMSGGPTLTWFDHTLGIRSHPLSGRSSGCGQGVPRQLWGGLTDRFCISIVIGMHNLLRFSPLFAGILFWPPVLRFPLASLFLLCFAFFPFKTQIFSHWPVSVLLPHHRVQAGPFAEAALRASGIYYHEYWSCRSCCFAQTQTNGHVVMKMLDVPRF